MCLRTADEVFRQADGRCCIEVELLNRLSTARASQSQVIAGAEAVVDGCIRGNPNPKGGKAEHISECLEPNPPKYICKL